VERSLIYIGSARKDLETFPLRVREDIAVALDDARVGGKSPRAKLLKGFGGSGVLEVVEDHAGDTYRAVYTVRFRQAVYILAAFKKKSTHGIKTPKRELDLVRQRLRLAEVDHQQRFGR
jgi:phage-related protein